MNAIYADDIFVPAVSTLWDVFHSQAHPHRLVNNLSKPIGYAKVEEGSVEASLDTKSWVNETTSSSFFYDKILLCL